VDDVTAQESGYLHGGFASLRRIPARWPPP
jgi:hypothetical protein